jgi:hypothetical protein
MSISYQAKSSPVLGRQLEAQEVQSVCDLTASPAKSDAPSIVSIDATDPAAVEISIKIDESLREERDPAQPQAPFGGKIFSVQVIDRATGTNLTLAGVPALSSDKKSIEVVVDCTGADSICVKACYKVAE